MSYNTRAPAYGRLVHSQISNSGKDISECQGRQGEEKRRSGVGQGGEEVDKEDLCKLSFFSATTESTSWPHGTVLF